MFEVAHSPYNRYGRRTRMAARFAPQQTELASLVRQQQDAVEQWRAIDRMLTEQLAGKTSLPRNREIELHRELTKLSESIEGLDETLRKKFHKFTELTNPRPVSLQTVQKLLTSRVAADHRRNRHLCAVGRQNNFKLAHTNDQERFGSFR